MKHQPSRTRSIVVSNVNAEIGRRRITQKQMAEWLGISQASASERLTNKTPFTLDELDILAEKFDMPVVALFSQPAYSAPFQGGSVGETAPIAQLAELRTF
jgi:predicted XRE-type DNA-binding protein